MTVLSLFASAFSVAIILLLCAGDPKRRRAQKLTGDGHGTRVRRLFAAAALLPGLVLIAMAEPAAFLIWLGACSVAGWFAALLFRDRSAV